MNVLKEDKRKNLQLLIENSCISQENIGPFEQFHKMLIAISYEATNVCIDYVRKRVYMDVFANQVEGDLVVNWEELMSTKVFLNLSYNNLSEFLKACALDEGAIHPKEYPLLKSHFLKAKSFFEKRQPQKKLRIYNKKNRSHITSVLNS